VLPWFDPDEDTNDNAMKLRQEKPHIADVLVSLRGGSTPPFGVENEQHQRLTSANLLVANWLEEF
jgi:hypothetical protein